MKPLIGMTAALEPAVGALQTNSWSLYKTNHDYVDSVRRSGGTPLMLPFGTLEEARQYAAAIDGLLVPGGGDIAPLLYGEEPIRGVTYVSRDFDRFEIELIQEAARLHKPILGICRGHQVLNVAFGGTLYQDLPSQLPDTICHCQANEIRGELFHSVSLVPGSKAASLIGKTEIEVNSFHHQAVKKLGEGLVCSGKSPDGVVEAIEAKEGFIVGVEWHPENLSEHHAEYKRLFDGFVAACAK
ncbi:MAG: gamma-glutamyl-gamma-aminobutyrate hydrolase family protein [Clostridiales bacterium]|uniref:gamma-glutamyl-gamma-aminobutyrate hydrolase family protein n=1 Tax=Provencibacterium massiliense TaxID=1841868 RepID=UPI0009A79D81|nr:gamma-glutamyl-gamma-aminobutyrate hydrolase family protein [Provencibacterium massiliense]PWM36759.1 MAG: gamma-glutamyl-gamma-aminobutyrate hydrolase family protein [Clostridiales bacterium]RGB63652.1 gamma-glutamyl-gamma-aminobutyrate hydrolase family protein [Harryflintia acetispora]